MNIHMRKKIAFLLAFAMVMIVAMQPISSIATTGSEGNSSTGVNTEESGDIVPASTGNDAVQASGSDASQGNSTPEVTQGNSTPEVTQGNSTPVVTQGNSTPVVTQGNSTPVVAQGNSTPVVTQGQQSNGSSSTPSLRPDNCTCEGTSHDTANTNCPLYVAPQSESQRPDNCTCEGTSHDTANTECPAYVAPQSESNRPDNCTCEGTSHDTANTECPAYVAPQFEPRVVTDTAVTYDKLTSGSVSVTVVWDEDVPADTTLSFALQYARENDHLDSGVTQPLTVIKPSNAATFTNVPVSIEKTTVTTTLTTPYDPETGTWPANLQQSTSETTVETVGYTHALISANAGTGYRVTTDGLSLRVSVRAADEVDQTTNAVIAFNWNNIPEDQDPKVSISLLSNGTAVANSETTLGKGTSSFGYYGLPLKDTDGNEITYTVAAERSASSVDGGFTVSADGLTVTVNWLENEALSSVLSEITALIDTLPATVPSFDADPLPEEELAGIRDKLTRIKALLNELAQAQRGEISNISLYNEWDEYVAFAVGTLVENISMLSFADIEGEPSNQSITINGSVAFSPAAVDPVAPPRSVVVKLLQDGVVVRSQGVAITSNNGTFGFGDWPVYNGATGNAYIYSVCGSSVTGYVASTDSNFAVRYDSATDTSTNQDYVVTVDFITTGATGADATPEATVQMFKNDNPVNGQSHNFTASGTHTFTVPVKSGDVVIPRPEAINKYKVTISGLTITYTYVGDKTNFSGTINWVNASRFSKPPLFIKILGTLKTGVTGKPATVTESITTLRMDADSTTFIFSELDADYTYVIDTVTNSGTSTDDTNYTISFRGTTITATRSGDPLMRVGVTMRWVDNGNKRERRPNETTVYLFRDGVYTGDATQISEASGWFAIFYDQPYSNGSHIYQYSVRAHKIPYYWSRCTRLSNFGFLITQFYGRRSYEPTTSAAPKVGDPTLFRTELTDMMRREAASNASVTAALAGVTLNAAETEPATVDFDTLKRINGDVVGWISLSGTSIDNPIVRGNNNTKYLSRLWSGEANSAGSIFMDYHNSGKFANKNTIIYGHNMQNGTMFNELLSYRNQSFYEANKSISLQTPYGDYSLEPVAGFFTKEAYTNVAKYSFISNSAFLSYVDTCIDNSDFQSETSVSATDKLVTLVTCSNDYDDGTRYLLVCKLTALD